MVHFVDLHAVELVLVFLLGLALEEPLILSQDYFLKLSFQAYLGLGFF